MNELGAYLKPVTNRLVLVCVLAFFVVDGVFKGTPSGLELYFFENPDFRYHQLITSIFMHGGLTHLALNMIALWSFGQVLEKVWGAQRLLFFFLACGVGAGAISLVINAMSFDSSYQNLINLGANSHELSRLLADGQISSSLMDLSSREALSELYYLYNAPMVGASGAIYGILVAFALLFPNFKVQLIFLPIPIAARYFVPVLLMVDVVAGFTGFSIFGLNIAHFAHVGGAIVGAILVYFWTWQLRSH